MIEIYNKTIRNYSAAVTTYVKQALESTPVIESKRDVAMGMLAGKREDRKVELPFASVSFTGDFEQDAERYNYFHHRKGVVVSTDTNATVRIQRLPILLPTEVNFWGKDSDITYGLFSAFLLYNSFDPFITVINDALNFEHRTSVMIDSVSDQSQDTDSTVSQYYNITMGLRVEGWFHLTSEGQIITEIISRIIEEPSEEVLGTVINT